MSLLGFFFFPPLLNVPLDSASAARCDFPPTTLGAVSLQDIVNLVSVSSYSIILLPRHTV